MPALQEIYTRMFTALSNKTKQKQDKVPTVVDWINHLYNLIFTKNEVKYINLDESQNHNGKPKKPSHWNIYPVWLHWYKVKNIQ